MRYRVGGRTVERRDLIDHLAAEATEVDGAGRVARRLRLTRRGALRALAAMLRRAVDLLAAEGGDATAYRAALQKVEAWAENPAEGLATARAKARAALAAAKLEYGGNSPERDLLYALAVVLDSSDANRLERFRQVCWAIAGACAKRAPGATASPVVDDDGQVYLPWDDVMNARLAAEREAQTEILLGWVEEG